MQQLFRTPNIIIPHLIGKQVHEILPLVTQYNLNIRLIDQKEESDLPEGIILNQIPTAGTTIKSNQPLFLVTTKKPLPIFAPACIEKHIDDLVGTLRKNDINHQIYYVPHAYPKEICFAQSHHAHESLEKEKLILYISSGNDKPIIWPSFVNMPLQEVIEFLSVYTINPSVINDATDKEQRSDDYIIIDQRPFAGTLLTLNTDKPLSVQLRIR